MRQSGEATIIPADINDGVGNLQKPVQSLIRRTASVEQCHLRVINFTHGALFIIMVNWANALVPTAVPCLPPPPTPHQDEHGTSLVCVTETRACVFSVPVACFYFFICNALRRHNIRIVPITPIV